MKNLLILPLLLLALVSCKDDEENSGDTTIKYIGCTKALENQGDCIRWMDRTIYLAFSNASAPQKNNEFQKQKIKEALTEIADNTSLGPNYFNFVEVDDSLLPPVFEPGLSPNQYRSFIQVWPDAEFNDFIVNTLGGSVPDQNAVVVINSAYKRKFYIIMRASCFDSQAQCNSITTNGLRALLARQMGFLVGITPENCTTKPNDVMCVFPVDSQWVDPNKSRWESAFDNNLELILNNANYYDEFIPSN